MRIFDSTPRRVKGALSAAALLLGSHQAAAYVIDVHQVDLSGIGSLAAADAVIAAPGSLIATGTASILELDDLGDGTRGAFSIDNPWPGGATSSFAAHVTGSFSTGAGAFTFGVNHDDGMRLMIDGLVVALADGVVDNRDTFTAPLVLAAGAHTLDIVFFENFGGASLEFFKLEADGSRTLVPSIPEPVTITLLGLGLVGAGLRRRRLAMRREPA